MSYTDTAGAAHLLVADFKSGAPPTMTGQHSPLHALQTWIKEANHAASCGELATMRAPFPSNSELASHVLQVSIYAHALRQEVERIRLAASDENESLPQCT